MKRNHFLRLIITVGLFFWAAIVQATPVPPPEAAAWAEEKGALLLTTFKEPDLQKRYQTLDRLFVEYVDLDYVSRFVVGKYWRQMTPEQQKSYQQIFNRYALAVYKTFPLEFAHSLRYEVTGAIIEGKNTVVSSVVHVSLKETEPPQDFLLQFRLDKNRGKIWLQDIKMAESSLILSYRSRFYEMIAANDGDIEWFIEDLTDLTLSAEKQTQNRLSASQN